LLDTTFKKTKQNILYTADCTGTYGFADAFGLDNSLYGVCHADELYYFWKPYWNKGAIQACASLHGILLNAFFIQ
jgi:hypothetical protein